jgi:GR25 family glycosyltransferase involved in LPS biosynthesis
MNFVISLPSADDRRLHIAEEFEKNLLLILFLMQFSRIKFMKWKKNMDFHYLIVV